MTDDMPTESNEAGFKSKIAGSLKKSYDRFVKIRGNPREIALGFALGLFIGMTPTMGFQMGISVFLAAFFKWNKFAAAAGVWITNPVTAPFIYGLAYHVGAWFLGIEKAGFHLQGMNLEALIKQTPELLWIVTVGGIILGVPIAVIGYYVSLSAVLRYREKIQKALTYEKEKLVLTKQNIQKKIARKKKKK